MRALMLVSVLCLIQVLTLVVGAGTAGGCLHTWSNRGQVELVSSVGVQEEVYGRSSTVQSGQGCVWVSWVLVLSSLVCRFSLP